MILPCFFSTTSGSKQLPPKHPPISKRAIALDVLPTAMAAAKLAKELGGKAELQVPKTGMEGLGGGIGMAERW